MAIETCFTTDAAVARRCVADHLRADPIRHNVVSTLLDAREASSTPIRFWWATVDGEVRGALFQSPDTFPVSATVLDPDVIEPLAAAVAAAAGPPIPAIDAVADVASRFAGAFATVTRRPAHPAEGQRIYEIDEVSPPSGVRGGPRVAVDADTERVAALYGGFAADTGMQTSADLDDTARARVSIQSGRLHLWDVDAVARTSTITQGPADGVERVGFVYTPPADRGNGYASALVAHVSSEVLGRGHRCILYTQLANPISNAIYQRLGYRPVAECIRYRFDG